MTSLYIKEKMEQSITKIIKILQEEYPFLRITNLVPFANGVENLILKAYSSELGSVVIKTPIEQFVNNDNDGSFNARRLLKKEINLIHHASKYGIPVPKIYQAHFSEAIDFIISEYVANDESSPSAEKVGTLLSNLHGIPLPDVNITKQQDQEYYKPIAERILLRTKTVEKITKTNLPLCNLEELLNIFGAWEAKTSLLHLDIRPANFIMYQGEVKALLDWSNALIGDPNLEIMRILVQEELNPTFLKSYHLSNYIDETPELIKVLYRYDAIVMMTILFLSEIHDQKMGAHYFNKLVEINSKFRKLV